MSELWELSASELSRRLEAREVSSEEATGAYLARIDALNGRLRAFTEVLRAEALEAARRADARRKEGARGPLLGVPVSIKESIDCAGKASTLGVASRRAHVAKADGAMVQLLREAGAVILGRTNVPQFLIYHESRNPLFGTCANPWSLAHTPGGSSGGEGAALAAGMSALGVGTDIGGSIRVPAHFSGIAGLKPTPDRWSNRGSNTALLGQEGIRGQIGPMARTSADVALFMAAIDPLRLSALDGRSPPLPWRDPASFELKGMRVGVMREDGWVPTSAAVLRGIERAAAALAARGCEVVEFTPPALDEVIEMYFSALSADGGATMLPGLAGGEVDPVLRALVRMVKLPGPLRRGLAKVLERMGEGRASRLLGTVGERSVADLWRLTHRIRGYRFTLTEALDRARIDLVIGAAHATPALPHGRSKDFAVAGAASMLWNLAHFPAGVVPVTRVRAEETRRAGRRDRFEKIAAEVDARSAGLPVGVQVAARPWQDELVVAGMLAIEAGVSADADFPKTPVSL
jgi:fatty acid amide hydrolase